MKHRPIEMEVVPFPPTSPSVSSRSALGTPRGVCPWGTRSRDKRVCLPQARRATAGNAGPAGACRRVFLRPRRKLSSAVPSPARRPPPAERLAGTHSCAACCTPGDSRPRQPGNARPGLRGRSRWFSYLEAQPPPLQPAGSPAWLPAGGGRRARKPWTGAFSGSSLPYPQMPENQMYRMAKPVLN